MTGKSSDEETALWRRRFASEANNRAWTLSEQASRTAAEDTEMLHAAHAARYLWGAIGTAQNLAAADLLLGHVHALLGFGATAAHYVAGALAHFTSQPSLPWQLAFAYAVQANAASVCGDAALHRASYAKALEIADTITSPENRRLFDATLNVIPKPRD
jgi:hypothetical protein